MKGTLSKKSPSMLKGWQQRFVVLKDKKLRYYKNENSKFAKGCINFEFYEVTIKRSQKDPLCIKLFITGVNERRFQFKAATVDSATAWLTEILKHIG
jgi:hypothetical protein